MAKKISSGAKAKARKVVNGGSRTNKRRNTLTAIPHRRKPRKGPAETGVKMPANASSKEHNKTCARMMIFYCFNFEKNLKIGREK